MGHKNSLLLLDDGVFTITNKTIVSLLNKIRVKGYRGHYALRYVKAEAMDDRRELVACDGRQLIRITKWYTLHSLPDGHYDLSGKGVLIKTEPKGFMPKYRDLFEIKPAKIWLLPDSTHWFTTVMRMLMGNGLYFNADEFTHIVQALAKLQPTRTILKLSERDRPILLSMNTPVARVTWMVMPYNAEPKEPKLLQVIKKDVPNESNEAV